MNVSMPSARHVTSHPGCPAELRSVADEDARYTNVSMSFDIASLAPTYELCWGAAGASNALDIAQVREFASLPDLRPVASLNVMCS